MKFLICGLGSAGQRHYRNLKQLGHDDLIVYRTGKGNKDFVQKFLDEFHPKVFEDLALALAEKPDAVFVANPTSLHVPTALRAARAGYHLFIEKPLSHNWDQVDELRILTAEKRLITYVGYHLRFHPLLRKAKEWLAKGLIGKPVSAHAVMGERISDWHPWEDYRQSYACRKELGGGVILTQSHELDYLYWFFGRPKQVMGVSSKASDFEIDVEDVAKIVVRFDSLVVSVSLDYIRTPATRTFEIIGTKGRIFWNDQSVSFCTTNPARPNGVLYSPTSSSRNDMYVEELKHFLWSVENRTETINNVWQGAEVLWMALEAKK